MNITEPALRRETKSFEFVMAGANVKEKLNETKTDG